MLLSKTIFYQTSGSLLPLKNASTQFRDFSKKIGKFMHIGSGLSGSNNFIFAQKSYHRKQYKSVLNVFNVNFYSNQCLYFNV